MRSFPYWDQVTLIDNSIVLLISFIIDTAPSEFSQVPHQNSAKCHTKIQPSTTPKSSQVPHLVLKSLLKIIIIRIFEPQIMVNN